MIMGYGEIGQAIGKVLKDSNIEFDYLDISSRTVNPDEKYRCVHVCIPYTDSFLDIIKTHLEEYKYLFVIIHSTVSIGTTKALRAELRRAVVHSPVIGVHPNLVGGLKTFTKYVGGNNVFDVNLGVSHLKHMGLKVEHLGTSDETEAAKLFSTSYYGWNIIFVKEVKKFCDEKNLDFNKVYTEWNNNYNNGFRT